MMKRYDIEFSIEIMNAAFENSHTRLERYVTRNKQVDSQQVFESDLAQKIEQCAVAAAHV
jgi:hypothetical protein